MANQDKRLTQDEVNQICDEISGRGERPTPTVISKEITEKFNKNPSYTTIQAKLKVWNDENAGQTEIDNLPVKVELPDNLLKLATDTAKSFLKESRLLARDEVETERKALKKAELEVNLKIDELQAFLNSQTETIDSLQNQIAELINKRDDLGAALTNEQQQHQITKDERLSFETELKLSQQQASGLKEQLGSVQDDLKEAVAHVDQVKVDSDNSIKVLEKQINVQESSLQNQIDLVAKIEQEKSKLSTSERKQLEKQATLTGKLDITLKENKALTAKAKNDLSDIKELERQTGADKEKIKSLQNDKVTHDKEHTERLEQCEKYKKEVDMLNNPEKK